MTHSPKGQKHIDLILLCFLVLLCVMLLPLTVLYILAIYRGELHPLEMPLLGNLKGLFKT